MISPHYPILSAMKFFFRISCLFLLGYTPVVFAQETLLEAPNEAVYRLQPPIVSIVNDVRPTVPKHTPQPVRKWDIRKKTPRDEVRIFIDPVVEVQPNLEAVQSVRLMRDETNPVPDENVADASNWVVGRQLTLVETMTDQKFRRSVTMLGGKGGVLCSCVLFARTLVPALPYGLHNYRDKLDIINSQMPEVGHVAIMKSPSGLGHVAVIKSVNEDGSLTIEEGNFRRCKRNIRTDMPERMNIKGYFDPNS